MNPTDAMQRVLSNHRPKPKGKQAKLIRKMLREGVHPSRIPFDPSSVDKIFSKLPDSDRQKIVKKVTEQEVEVEVTDEQADRVIRNLVVGSR